MDAPLPYRSFSSWLKERYGGPVAKVPLVTGLGCPNRDGTIARDGCLFCDANQAGHGPSVVGGRDLAEQYRIQVERRRDRGRRAGYLAYLQAGSNTHGDAATLAALYAQARALPGLVGVSIATRPDLVSDAVLDLIERSFVGLDVWIELGVQSAHDATLAVIGRNHAFADVVGAVARVRARGFLACAHVVLGLPGEEDAEIRASAGRLRDLSLDGVKLHPLVVTRGSRLEAAWRAGPFPLIREERYVGWAVDFLERTDARVVVQRLVGAGRPEVHVAPAWPLEGARVRRRIVEEFARRGTRQGARAGAGSS